MKKILTILQILDGSGRVNVHLLLLLIWAIRVSVDREINWFHVMIGLFFVINLQLERFFRTKETTTLHKSEQERLSRLEADLATLSGLLSMSNQRSNMF